MKRDSIWWWVVMGGAIATAALSRFDLLEVLLPAAHSEKIHAVLEMIALVSATLAGVMKASPLPISDKGRAKYTSDTVRLDR